MPIPDFQQTMLPLLQLAADGAEHTVREAVEAMAAHFQLTDEERRELLPSGRQARIDNRVAWSIVHIRKAGLLRSSGRGRFQITERGQDALRSNPAKIDLRFLMQFPEFVEFRTASRQATRTEADESEDAEATVAEAVQTPEELLEASYQSLRRTLAQDLLDRISRCPPAFFEQLVVDLLVAMGYGGSRQDAGQAIGKSGDDGIDGIIKEDKLGLDAVYIQAKRWQNPVGSPQVREFAGSLMGQRATKGVLITTSRFSQDARDYVSRIDKKIVLIDGETLAGLMIDHGVGVTEVARYAVKKIDSDYFGE